MPLETFSNEELIKWVDTVLDDKDNQIFEEAAERDDMKKAFRDNNVTGKMLAVCNSMTDVKTMMNKWKDGKSYGYLKSTLFVAIVAQKETDENDADGTAEDDLASRVEAEKGKRKGRQQGQKGNNGSNGYDGGDGTGNIKISYTGTEVGLRTLKYDFKPSDKVAFLIELICEDSGTTTDQARFQGSKTKASLKWHGKNLDESKTLGELGFMENAYNVPVVVTFKVVGGSHHDQSYEDAKYDGSSKRKKIILKLDANSDKRERLPDWESKTGIKASLKPDCIMGYNSKKELRVEMPCGHVFSSKTIFRLAKMNGANIQADNISCPMAECGMIWDYNAVVAAGDFDEDETIYFGNLFEKRKLLRGGNVKECVSCGSFVTLPDELGKIRVRCPRDQCKSRKDFCWACGKDWKGGGFSLCGNKDCPTMSINDTLKNCEMIKPKYLGDMECPSLRACPRCLKICEWDSECKHMTCWGCKTKFCFICLSIFDKETKKWPATCGWVSTKCQMKERQQLKN